MFTAGVRCRPLLPALGRPRLPGRPLRAPTFIRCAPTLPALAHACISCSQLGRSRAAVRRPRPGRAARDRPRARTRGGRRRPRAARPRCQGGGGRTCLERSGPGRAGPARAGSARRGVSRRQSGASAAGRPGSCTGPSRIRRGPRPPCRRAGCVVPAGMGRAERRARPRARPVRPPARGIRTAGASSNLSRRAACPDRRPRRLGVSARGPVRRLPPPALVAAPARSAAPRRRKNRTPWAAAPGEHE
jgi:hypothetical protein